ncbi:MAG: IS701 family transposase [Cyanobacteria bacterium J06638_22]
MLYQSLFPEARSFEAFKYLHVGMLSDIKRKSLPAIAKAAGLANEQSLHHFLTDSPWSVAALRRRRLELILQSLKGRPLILLIDETGDRKKGHATAYVRRQYIGNLGKVENGIVAVTAYGLVGSMTYPLMFSVYKPKDRLEAGDVYRSKPQIAAQMIRELTAMGFQFELVLADSLYGESGVNFLSVLDELTLDYVVAIRSNHGVWLPRGERVRYNRWRKFERVFTDGKRADRYIREIVFGRGKKRLIRYWEITTDPATRPVNGTWYVMTKKADIKYHDVGNLYGLRNWVEYGLKQSKNELGWADFRVTDYAQIERWWEVVMSAYLLVSLHSVKGSPSNPEAGDNPPSSEVTEFTKHAWWNEKKGWKNLLNNLRLVLQPLIFCNLIQPWLKVFAAPQLARGFAQLIALMNQFPGAIPEPDATATKYFSSA